MTYYKKNKDDNIQKFETQRIWQEKSNIKLKKDILCLFLGQIMLNKGYNKKSIHKGWVVVCVKKIKKYKYLV